MCVNLSTLAMSAADTVSAGNKIQAFTGAVNALGDLAMGVTKQRMMNADARGARMQGEQRAKRIRAAGDQELGRARADAAGAGVSVGSDSVLAAERQIVRGSEQDAAIAILTGENQATSLELSGKMYRNAGVFSALDGMVGAADKWRRSKYAEQQNIWSPGYDDVTGASGGWTGMR